MYNHHGHRGDTTSHHSINKEMESHNQSDQRSLDREGLDHMRLPFAYKLHILLGDMESSDCEHIISWVEDGKAFKIHNKEKFEDLIQPRYFRQSKLSSFIRQCYMYGFSKVEGGPSHGSYVHPNFCRMDQAKSLTIQRQLSTQSRRHHHHHVNGSQFSKKVTSCPSLFTTTTETKAKPSCLIASKRSIDPLCSHRGITLRPDPAPIPLTTINALPQEPSWEDSSCLQEALFQLPENCFWLLDSQPTIFTNDLLDIPYTFDESMFEPRPIELMCCSFSRFL